MRLLQSRASFRACPLRIPMRGYELPVHQSRMGFLRSYESPWGVMSPLAVKHLLKQMELRIPMRGYEPQNQTPRSIINDVTNPHEGLWVVVTWKYFVVCRCYESPWGVMSLLCNWGERNRKKVTNPHEGLWVLEFMLTMRVIFSYKSP